MNKKEMKQALAQHLRYGYNKDNIHVYQDRPWTFVEFEVEYNETYHQTFGFSKVCRPDKWDEEYGIELAITKALYKLAKEILAKETE